MKFVVFGGLLFIGGVIMYSTIYPPGVAINEFRNGLGICCMLIGLAIGIFGLVKKDEKQD